ncbi:MAG: helix-turn-helix domain-containing protein [Roseburia sp.]|nr:helix-turn-helix domain-containing protein [Anaeroplasma bactoclasticum]MCM1197138.1 helix-turn-helix domain-containing protein [Roseburia sp.]MCM1557886.1 helix-turn-helix domain-containing protein [Anaeroplasma bactoclasticum]
MNRIKMGEFLTELRKEKDLSQTDLAEIIGVTFQAVSKWERGEAIPDISILEKLSSFYSVSIDEIIKGETILHQNKLVATEESFLKNKEEQNENWFLNQKRAFGFWFSLAYLILFVLFGFCPFARALIFRYDNVSTYIIVSYYTYIFSSSFDVWNFFLLFQFLTTIAIVALTMLFYVCRTQKTFKALFITRFILLIINLLTVIVNVAVMSDSSLDASIGCYAMFFLIIPIDILFISLKQNRKKYILQDFRD